MLENKKIISKLPNGAVLPLAAEHIDIFVFLTSCGNRKRLHERLLSTSNESVQWKYDRTNYRIVSWKFMHGNTTTGNIRYLNTFEISTIQ